VRKVTEPSDGCAPLVVVRREKKLKNGENSVHVRLCVDYAELNKQIKRERFLLPAVNKSLAKIGNGKFFSILDANSGFHQIPLTESSIPYTTFLMLFGRYQFLRLPFGINAAPKHYQRQINKVLHGEKGCICQMDNI